MNRFSKFFATVFTDNHGQHKLMLPSGEVLPHQIKSVVVDEIGEIARFDVSALCNIVQTKEQALEGYGVKDPWVKSIDEKPSGSGFFKCFGTVNKGTEHVKRTSFNAFYDGDRFVDKDGEDLTGINESVEYWFDFSAIQTPV